MVLVLVVMGPHSAGMVLVVMGPHSAAMVAIGCV